VAGEFDPTVFKCGGQQTDISCQSNVNTADYAALHTDSGARRGEGEEEQDTHAQSLPIPIAVLQSCYAVCKISPIWAR
jgi:hypothetical protein